MTSTHIFRVVLPLSFFFAVIAAVVDRSFRRVEKADGFAKRVAMTSQNFFPRVVLMFLIRL